MPTPLATVLRPQTLEDFIGQLKLVGPNGPLRQIIQSGQVPSMIFWGPAASGKTTLANIIAQAVEADFLQLSAVMDGKEELKRVLEQAKRNKSYGQSTILFIDEIHRWNKAQQDALLPHVESGNITLIGATTENPSFEIISPLLSRARVFVFEQHTVENIEVGLRRGWEYLQQQILPDSTISLETDLTQAKSPKLSEVRPPMTFDIDATALRLLAELSNGDIRFGLNSLELAFQLLQSKGEGVFDQDLVESTVQKFLRHDKSGEEHYNLISAVHKSLRSSHPTAAVYWITRMLQAGDDPLYIARRLLRFASEDIGNSSPTALILANAVFDTCHKLGMPECETALAQLGEYLARAPKSNTTYTASKAAKADVEKYGNLPVPLHFRNAPTRLMREIGYGSGYEYDHDLDNKKSTQECLPTELQDRNYFE